MTSTIDARKDAQANGTYDVYIDIDCDCEELLDAIGLDYTTSEDDEHQNEVKLILNKDEYNDLQERCDFNATNEQFIGCALLNHELGEYTTRVQIYKPNGDKVTFE
tara:strand:- start:292 stop:609 length:318 start_codon:yes stop_codon:yes gene_type:complete